MLNNIIASEKPFNNKSDDFESKWGITRFEYDKYLRWVGVYLYKRDRREGIGSFKGPIGAFHYFINLTDRERMKIIMEIKKFDESQRSES